MTTDTILIIMLAIMSGCIAFIVGRIMIKAHFRKPEFRNPEDEYGSGFKGDFDKVRKVSPYSRKDGSPFNRENLNRGFLKASKEDRAITSPGFAKAFYEANRIRKEA